LEYGEYAVAVGAEVDGLRWVYLIYSPFEKLYWRHYMDYIYDKLNGDVVAMFNKKRILYQCAKIPIICDSASRVGGEKSNPDRFRRLAQVFEQLPPTSC